MMRIISLISLLMVWMLAACAGAGTPVAVLPTIAELPTETAEVRTPSPLATSGDSGQVPLPTVASATATLTATHTATQTLTVTPSITITDTPTRTATATPTITETPLPTSDTEGISALIQLALQATILPTAILPSQPVVQPTIPLISTGPCPVQPPGGFGVAFITDLALQGQIGCPIGATLTMSSATQNYERGQMFWVAGPPGSIYSLTSSGRYQRYDDTFNAAVDPERGGETPPAGLLEPVRGFGKVWRSFPDVRNGIGWAINQETGGTSTVQLFDRGQMIAMPQWGQIVVLIYDPGNPSAGSWRGIVGGF